MVELATVFSLPPERRFRNSPRCDSIGDSRQGALARHSPLPRLFTMPRCWNWPGKFRSLACRMRCESLRSRVRCLYSPSGILLLALLISTTWPSVRRLANREKICCIRQSPWTSCLMVLNASVWSKRSSSCDDGENSSDRSCLGRAASTKLQGVRFGP